MAKFLLVDDSPTVRLSLANALRNANRGSTDILEAPDGETAMKEFERVEPDAVFLDLMLPKMSGLEVLRKMLAIRPEAKVILVTGLPAADPQVVQGIAAGAFGFLAKPARTDTVRKILNDMETESGRFGRIR